MGYKIFWDIRWDIRYKMGYKIFYIRSFGKNIYAGKTTTDEAGKDQRNLLKNTVEINEKSRPKTKEGKDKKKRYL